MLQPEPAGQGGDELPPCGICRELVLEVLSAPMAGEGDDYPEFRAWLVFDNVVFFSSGLASDLSTRDNPWEIGPLLAHISGYIPARVRICPLVVVPARNLALGC
jgi:hypothetical protein